MRPHALSGGRATTDRRYCRPTRGRGRRYDTMGQCCRVVAVVEFATRTAHAFDRTAVRAIQLLMRLATSSMENFRMVRERVGIPRRARSLLAVSPGNGRRSVIASWLPIVARRCRTNSCPSISPARLSDPSPHYPVTDDAGMQAGKTTISRAL